MHTGNLSFLEKTSVKTKLKIEGIFADAKADGNKLTKKGQILRRINATIISFFLTSILKAILWVLK